MISRVRGASVIKWSYVFAVALLAALSFYPNGDNLTIYKIALLLTLPIGLLLPISLVFLGGSLSIANLSLLSSSVYVLAFTFAAYANWRLLALVFGRHRRSRIRGLR